MGNYIKAAFALTLIGGILTLLAGALIAVVGSAGSLYGMDQLAGAGAAASLSVMGAGGFIIGLLMIISSVMMRKPGKQRTWGIIAIILSLVSVFVGGFSIVLILGVVGGILAIISKP